MVVLAVTVGAGVLAGCSAGGGASPVATSAPASLAPSAPAPGGPATSAVIPASGTDAASTRAVGADCAPAGTGMPAGAVSGPTVDVDGDGRADSVWLQRNADGTQLAGITTASGATFGASYSSASPLPRRVLVADVNGAGTIAAIVSDGRQAGLFTVLNCSLVPAMNPQGAQYTFDLGMGVNGTGIGCSKVAGTSAAGLVGLKLNRDGAGKPVSVTRTAILLNRASASNGASDTVDVSGDPTGPAATTATQITCGDLTMKANGVG